MLVRAFFFDYIELMKNMKHLILPALLVFILTGCGGIESKAERRAKELCACLEKVGLSSSVMRGGLGGSFDRDFERKLENEFPELALEVVKKMEKDLKGLSNKEKKAYTKAFLKASIDTPCADIALDKVPYDMISVAREQLERQVKRNKRRERGDFEF